MDFAQMGMLGLGLGGDIMTGISQYEQARQMRDQRAKMMDPRYQAAMTQQYFDANKAALQQSLPEFMRQQINPMLGIRGIDPSGGTGQLIANQAIAQQLQSAYANAQNMARGGLQGAGQFIPNTYGQFGGTRDALYGMGQQQMMQQLMQQQNAMRTRADGSGGQRQSGLTDTANLNNYYNDSMLQVPMNTYGTNYGGYPLNTLDG